MTLLPIAKGLVKAPKMNKTEAAYGQLLEAMRRAGTVAAYWFEGVTLKLADDTRWTPDYFVLLPDGTCELHEVKGNFFRDDARVKTRVAARMYPFPVKVVRKAGAGFDVEIIPP